jgi:hypothetical protein
MASDGNATSAPVVTDGHWIWLLRGAADVQEGFSDRKGFTLTPGALRAIADDAERKFRENRLYRETLDWAGLPIPVLDPAELAPSQRELGDRPDIATLDPTAISGIRFSEMASRLAHKASSWASDCLTDGDRAIEPMEGEPVERFLREMRAWLTLLERTACGMDGKPDE